MNHRLRRLTALERQVARLERRLAALHTQSETYTRWRTLAFLAGAAAAFAGFAVDNALGVLVTLIGLAGFSVLVRLHRRLRASIARHQAWLSIRRAHLARMRIDWDDLPPATASAPPEHPFAADLDIVGMFSLHRLLDTAISRGGSDRLLGWLLTTTPDPAQIAARRALVTELTPLAAFRDKLTRSALLAQHRGKWDGGQLIAWLGREQGETVPPLALRGLLLLAALNLLLLILDAAGVVDGLWRFSLAAYVVASALALGRTGGLFTEALAIKSELDKLNAVLRFLEGYRYEAHPALRGLCAPFSDPAERPSRHLRRLNRILAASSVRSNAVLWLILNLIFPWDLTFAAQLDRSKGQLGTLLPVWLDAWHELEALNALANFAWLNPGYTWPTVTERGSGFTAARLGHPLIPHDARVVNDFALAGPGDVVIVTGSNMSGKSSFLRTVGVNLALAYAGGVVAADGLTTGLFRPFTCIRVADSVVDGISYFYAEVRRLRALLAALETPDAYPLLFLIDEIFRGTNNRERLIGSRAFIRALVGGNGCGLISTHDLELVRLADEVPGIRNVHFREDVIDGRMAFDYLLRDGPSPTTNALRIMALEGLPVEEPAGS